MNPSGSAALSLQAAVQLQPAVPRPHPRHGTGQDEETAHGARLLLPGRAGEHQRAGVHLALRAGRRLRQWDPQGAADAHGDGGAIHLKEPRNNRDCSASEENRCLNPNHLLGHNAVLLAGPATRQENGRQGGERDSQPTNAHHASTAQQL